jgi:major membrane immunogen (membrane-anchored lipoprotein)
MKLHGLMCLLIVCCMMVLLAACNRGDTATSNTNGDKSASGGSASSRTSGGQTVDVQLNEYTITSSTKDFKAGQAYHFVVHILGKQPTNS